MKYAIVTGASPSSIGFLAAKKLASPEFGYKVILACRNSDKGHETEGLIRSAYPSSEVVYVYLDLASFESIRKFVEIVRAMDDGAIGNLGLKILVNNAGVGWGSNSRSNPFLETSDHLEEIVGVNHFGTFLLTQLLLEDLKKAEGGSRVVIVSSSLHRKDGMSMKKTDAGKEEKLVLPKFPEDILQSRDDDDDYDGLTAYQSSKLCNLWYTYELQRRLDNEAAAATTTGDSESTSSVRVNALCPGFIPMTGLTRRAGAFGIFFLRYVLDPFRHIGMGVTRSPQDGAEVIVQVGTSDVASKGGQCFVLPRGETVITPVVTSKESMDEKKAKELWELSLKTCNLDA